MKIQTWRQKAREGTLTTEELRDAIQVLREGRVAAAKSSSTSRAKKVKPDGNALLDDFN